MKKKIFSMFLAAAMMLGALPLTALAVDSAQTQSPTDSIYQLEVDLPFDDVPVLAWYRKPVEFVYIHGIMVGVGDNKFAPNGTMTRAMVVQTLYADAGSPEVSGDPEFTDVTDPAKWYYNAVQWASQNGVAAGMGDGTFAPEAKVTREQFAQFLYGYEGSPEVCDWTLSLFEDADSVSDWAKPALTWANQHGIVNGIPFGDKLYLKPQDDATRAHAATMLSIYLVVR